MNRFLIGIHISIFPNKGGTVPEIAKVAKIEVLNLANVPSDYMDPALWVKLQKAVVEALARPEVAGVIVSHGTDTLEETAYFLDLTVSRDKPIVLIGAQRNASEKDFDGPRNIPNAARICVSPDARWEGCDDSRRSRGGREGHRCPGSRVGDPHGAGQGRLGRRGRSSSRTPSLSMAGTCGPSASTWRRSAGTRSGGSSSTSLRSMKSLAVSVFWPTWEWIDRPSTRWLFASYAATLSTRDSLKCRRIIESQWRELWKKIQAIEYSGQRKLPFS